MSVKKRSGLLTLAFAALAVVTTALSMLLLVPLALLFQALARSSQESEQQTTEFLWKRLEDPPGLGLASYLTDVSPMVFWLPVAGIVLLAGFFLVFYIYRFDGSAVGWGWGCMLAVVRTLVIVSLFVVWMLPAVRKVEVNEQRSRVVIIFDVSGSAQSSDDPPSDLPGQRPKSRQEVLIQRVLASTAASSGETATAKTEQRLLTALLEKNPIYCYRFGEQLDESPWPFEKPDDLNAFDWSRKLQPLARPTLAQPVFPEITDEFRKASKQLQEIDRFYDNAARNGQPDEPGRERRRKEVVDNLERAIAEDQQLHEHLLNRTNIGKALLDVLRKESGNTVQGIIVFSDGRNNAGSTKDIDEAVGSAKKAGIPIFTIGVGEHRDALNLRLADVLAPAQVQPEDEEWPVRVAIEGENMPKQQEVLVKLTIEKPDKPKEDIEKKVSLTETSSRLATGTAEFLIPNKEKLKGEWKFRARVEPVKGERTRADNVSEEPVIVKVVDRKLSLLLFCSAPMRDYQFLRTLLVREKDRFDLTIFIQDADPRTLVQDVDPKRILEKFPADLRDRNEDPNNLGNYDVVVAFDPDWSKLDKTVQENLRTWVEDFAGGLICVAGPIHAFHLARDKEGQGIIQGLYPVILDKSATSFDVIDRPTKDAWALNWGPAAAQMPFFDLTETGDKSKILEGWDLFFEVSRDANGIADRPGKRGFHAFFPVAEEKTGAQILARFSDKEPRSLTPKGQRQPYLVLQPAGKGQVFYIGSGEMWRLRIYEQKFHERFWTKLLRHMGRGDPSRGSRRGLLVVGNRYFEGDSVEVEAQLFDIEMKPLKPDASTKILLKVLAPEGTEVPKDWATGLEMKPAPGRAGWFNVRLQVRRAGKYGLELDIPGTRETLRGGFRVDSVDPERDLTRPDFSLLHRLATEVRENTGTEVREIRPLDDSKRSEFMRALNKARDRMKAQAKDAPPGTIILTAENDVDRLFFELDDAQLIATCIDSKIVPYRSEGKAQDFWDKGWTVFADLSNPDKASVENKSWRDLTLEDWLTKGIPWVLVLLVLLLSVEWLTRKLLTLA